MTGPVWQSRMLDARCPRDGHGELVDAQRARAQTPWVLASGVCPECEVAYQLADDPPTLRVGDDPRTRILGAVGVVWYTLGGDVLDDHEFGQILLADAVLRVQATSWMQTMMRRR